jgi:hypothetical protein
MHESQCNDVSCPFLCSGSLHFLASNNDCGLRDFDMERFQICNNFRFAWPVNVKSAVYSLTVYF